MKNQLQSIFFDKQASVNRYFYFFYLYSVYE